MTDLQTKQNRITELAKTIALYSDRVLSRAEKEQTENIQLRLEFRLGELVRETKEKEADLKIESMENILAVLKQK